MFMLAFWNITFQQQKDGVEVRLWYNFLIYIRNMYNKYFFENMRSRQIQSV